MVFLDMNLPVKNWIRMMHYTCPEVMRAFAQWSIMLGTKSLKLYLYFNK